MSLARAARRQALKKIIKERLAKEKISGREFKKSLSKYEKPTVKNQACFLARMGA